MLAAACTAAAAINPAAALHDPRSASAQIPVSGFAGGKWGDPAADKVAADGTAVYHADKDPGSEFTFQKAVGTRAVWGHRDRANRQLTGQGVAVALLDSGVSQVPGLDAAGKVTYGPDLSIESNGVFLDRDTYGHGTFMAGLIAGRGASNPSSDLPGAPPFVQLGTAPDAKLLALKLATSDGSTDVTEVIAALDWVTEHPVLPDGTRVRVINLSYGTDSTQSYTVDPLAAAAENAWKHGIVVVTSAGNAGSAPGTLTDPAYDPYVIAVGAADSGHRIDGWKNDRTTPASFSQESATRHPDLLAPGTSVVSLRDPGSSIDVQNPQGRVAGDTTGTLFRGSGTSQAAAVVSGAVADLLQAYPNLTPDQVKYVLTTSADPLKQDGSPAAAGAGIMDMDGAVNLAAQLSGTDKNAAALRTAAVQRFTPSTGQGSIDAARGGYVLLDADGKPISGEVDAQGNPWNAAAWWRASSNLTAWSGGRWMGVVWTGDGWMAGTDSFGSSRWSASRWSSSRWSDANWSSSRWSASRWSSSRWSSSRWSSARWSANEW